MTRTVRSELRLAFGILLGALLLVGTSGIVATTVTATYVERVTTTVAPAVTANDAILQSMTDIETGVRGYALSGRQSALEPYRQGLRRLPTQRARLAQLLDHTPRLRPLVVEQEAAIDAWLHQYAIPRVKDPAGPVNFDPDRFARAESLFEDFRAVNTDLRARLEVHLDDLRARATNLRRLTTLAVGLLTLTGLVVGAVATRLTSRRVRRPLARLRDVLTDLIAGQTDARADPQGPREVVTIARSVNALADETDRLRALEAVERRMQERLLHFGREVRSSLDPEQVVREGLAELGESLRLGRAYVRLVEGDALQDIGQQWFVPGIEPLSHLQTPGSVSALRAIHKRRRPLTSTDVRADPFYDTERGRHWADHTGARASLTLPIPVDEEPVGVITCIDFTPREWTDAEVRLAEAVAADLGRALAHAKLYTAQVEAVQRLEELDRAKDDFLSSVSHELRTPLTSINGYVELLEDDDLGPVSDQHRRMLAVIRRNVDRLRLLIEDLLTLSRIESGAFRSAFQPIDLAALVRSSLDDMRPQASEANVDVEVELPSDRVIVHGDPGQLSRALLNVIGNAIKFTPPAGQVGVSMHRRPEDHSVVVEVRDTGIGIPTADVGQIATRFFRAGNAIAAEVPGTGLGLVIVRTIVDNHGGSLDLSSREGEGTTVRLVLPMAQDATVSQPSRLLEL
jgi:two-component system, OmpR family, phosphate regulon sensor histidine kinase PhoR